jgi:hypothetical protein
VTDDMAKGDSVEGWSLQITLDNPNATISTGWLDGFNGTVTFDPSTGTFSNVGQDFQPELKAGDTIQFTIQVQNTGFNQSDISFTFQDLDPDTLATATSGDSASVAGADAGNAAMAAFVGLEADQGSATATADPDHPATADHATDHDTSATAGGDQSADRAPDGHGVGSDREGRGDDHRIDGHDVGRETDGHHDDHRTHDQGADHRPDGHDSDQGSDGHGIGRGPDGQGDHGPLHGDGMDQPADGHGGDRGPDGHGDDQGMAGHDVGHGSHDQGGDPGAASHEPDHDADGQGMDHGMASHGDGVDHGTGGAPGDDVAWAPPHSAADDYTALIEPRGEGDHASPSATDPSAAAAGQEHGVHATAAGDYMAMVQPQHDDQGAAPGGGADHGSASTDYAHMITDTSSHGAQAPQEPPSADHLFADAQVVEQGAAHDGGAPQPGADAQVDAALNSPSPEPPPEPQHHDQGHGGA